MREQFTFYRSFRDAIKRLKKADQLSAYQAIAAYALDGEIIPMTDAAEGMFILIKPTLDAACKKSDARKNRGKDDADNGNEDKTARHGEETGKTLVRPGEDNGKEKEREKEKENEYEIERENEKESKGNRTRQDKGKTSYGEYGWVKLTADEYAKLQRLMTPTELERCIRYVDEAAQSTNNKNKWKDWTLVIRRCAREGWGRRDQQPQYNRGKGAQPAPGDLKQPVAMELGEAELKAIQRMKEEAG